MYNPYLYWDSYIDVNISYIGSQDMVISTFPWAALLFSENSSNRLPTLLISRYDSQGKGIVIKICLSLGLLRFSLGTKINK